MKLSLLVLVLLSCFASVAAQSQCLLVYCKPGERCVCRDTRGLPACCAPPDLSVRSVPSSEPECKFNADCPTPRYFCIDGVCIHDQDLDPSTTPAGLK